MVHFPIIAATTGETTKAVPSSRTPKAPPIRIMQVPINQYMKREKKTASQFVLCIKNEDCEDLELRKIYQVLHDEEAAEDGYIRVIDESGEDYLYSQDYFVPVELSRAAEDALLAAA